MKVRWDIMDGHVVVQCKPIKDPAPKRWGKPVTIFGFEMERWFKKLLLYSPGALVQRFLSVSLVAAPVEEFVQPARGITSVPEVVVEEGDTFHESGSVAVVAGVPVEFRFDPSL